MPRQVLTNLTPICIGSNLIGIRPLRSHIYHKVFAPLVVINIMINRIQQVLRMYKPNLI